MTRKTILISFFLLFSTGVFAMPNMFNKDGVLHFNYKAEDLAPAEAAARVQLEKDLAALIAIPADTRTFENTILGYEKADDK